MDQQTDGIVRKKLASKDEAAKHVLLAEGNSAFDADDFERALDCYHRTSLIDGSDPSVWNMLGLTYTNLEFNQEAWRSFKLALQLDPDNLDTLWYSGEFLFGIEDMALTGVVLSRYVELEEEDEKRDEALEMLREVKLALGIDNETSSQPQFSSGDDEEEEDEDDDDQFEGFELEADDTEDELDEDDTIDDEGIADVEDHELLDDEKFVAHLSLQLERADSKCNSCETPIPIDAPYCYSCKAPNFYDCK